MTLSKSLAQSLLKLSEGEKIPSSKLRHHLIDELVAEGIIKDARSGRSKSLLYLTDPASLASFLWNKFSIADLKFYLDTLAKENLTRGALVEAGSDSKIKRIRTFAGFLVNSFRPIDAILKGERIVVHPIKGTFLFIHEPQDFTPAPDVTIGGVENPENFRFIAKQRELFKEINPLFVCRYPQNQSNDLINWLKQISNPYVHFGDFDFAGIGIYLNEYHRHLGSRAKFFVPDGIAELIHKHGNLELYNNQKLPNGFSSLTEPKVLELINCLHQYKKGLEQEIFINISHYDR